nr:MAG TPA: hypothetical protein [Caudoviricetes sp.]
MQYTRVTLIQRMKFADPFLIIFLIKHFMRYYAVSTLMKLFILQNKRKNNYLNLTL